MMIIVLRISMFIVPSFFALFLIKDNKENRWAKFIQFILYFIFVNTSVAFCIAFFRGVEAISFQYMTYSYCFKWLAIGMAFAIFYSFGVNYIWKYRHQIKANGIAVLHNGIQNIKTIPPLTILRMGVKIIMIVGLYIYGIGCTKNLDTNGTLALIWITSIAFILLFSSVIRSYLSKKEIYGPYFVLAALTPLWCFYLTEKIYNDLLDEMVWRLNIGNIIIMSIVFLILYINIPFKKAVIGAYWTLFFSYGLGNYYVIKFRGSPILPNDILAFKTAMQVADGYSFDISENIFIMSLNYISVLIMLLIFPIKKTVFQWKYMLLKLILSIMVIFELSDIKVNDMFDLSIATYQWNLADLYRDYGSVIGFISMLQNIAIKAPENYQRQVVEENLSEYMEYASSDNAIKPTIIAVMDESFCDLKILADFYTSDEYLYHWYEIDDYIYRGNLYVSTYGGGTANTEFEFLSGNSCGNLPAGIVPYQMYNLKSVGNITDILKSDGYQTIAAHSENKNNWSRAKVYENFGFSSFLDVNAFQNYETFRGHVTDKGDLDKVIDIFESSNEPQFIFNVTIQNHGGYYLADMEGLEIVELEDKWHDEYSDVEAYLTLIKESDKAINDFIYYFRTVDEPVILCIFGDHWPAINITWHEQVLGKSIGDFSFEETQRLRAVPYMIWANYEVDVPKQSLDTSANYLGAMLLDASGVSTSPYTEYLLDMRKYVPAINNLGYMANDGIWHSFGETTAVSQWVDDYEMMQYNAMFDSARDMIYYRP